MNDIPLPKYNIGDILVVRDANFNFVNYQVCAMEFHSDVQSYLYFLYDPNHPEANTITHPGVNVAFARPIFEFDSYIAKVAEVD